MSAIVLSPWDRHNRELASNAHPADWRNPEPAPRYNLVVVGAGTAGLVTAAGAAGLGAKVALVEKHLMGGEEEGLIKVHVRKGTDRILGATIVARHAGEMIGELTLAITAGVGLGTIARTIHPYPTQAECIKKVADAYNRTRLTPFAKAALGRWLRWTR